MEDLPNQEIVELLNQIGRGNDKAFTRLYRHYFDYIYRHIRKGMPDEATAEDVTNDVFEMAWKNQWPFKGDSRYSTYLTTIANRARADWYRKNGSNRGIDYGDDEVIEAQPDPNWDFVARLEDKQVIEALKQCMGILPAEMQDAFESVYYEGKGLKSVAKQLNCPEGTVKSRLFNAKVGLRKCISLKLGGPRNG